MVQRRGGGSVQRRGGGSGKKRERRKPRERIEKDPLDWPAKTQAGKLVQKGEITSIDQIIEKGIPILENEIVSALLRDLKEEVLNINSVQRTTDAGRKRRFRVCVAIGNNDGYVGIGIDKALNVRPAIDRASRKARLNIFKVKRGCGSWECGCGEEHSIPYASKGKQGSVSITLIPAPKGTGIVAGKTAKKVLELAGIKDVWSRTSGQTASTVNFAQATINALKNIRKTRMAQELEEGEKK